MSVDSLRAFAADSIRPIRDSLALNRWAIEVEYCSLADGLMGDVTLLHKYYRAYIRIDLQKHPNKRSVLDTVRHEMLHIVLADLELIKEVGDQAITAMESSNMFSSTFDHGVEKCVANLELLLDKLGITPQSLIRKGNKSLGITKPKRKRCKRS